MSRASHQRFIQLLAPLAMGLQAYVRYLAWSQNDVEDIFQTALLNAYEKFDTFEEGTNFKAWILKFVTFAAYNSNRKHHHLTQREILTEAEEILSAADGKDSTLETFQDTKEYEEFLKNPGLLLPKLSQEIQEAVKQLPEKRRSIFLLRAIGDLSYKEIAKLCEIPEGSVMGEIFRARKSLRESLRKETKIAEKSAPKDGDSHAV